MKESTVQALFEYLMGTILAEQVCACVKERILEYTQCQHCGKVHGLEGDERGAGGVEEDVECGECRKKMAASRFASHLEKCLGSSATPTKNSNNSSPRKASGNSNNNKKRKQK